MLGDKKKGAGFTIVELLIVIVIIGILAAITVVAYNGIQQRANNSARISAISQLMKLINGYTATYGTYPTTFGSCGTLDNLCTNSTGTANTGGNTTLMNELKKIGTPPQQVQPAVGGNYGVQYIYESTATYNGDPAPIRLEFWLDGQNVPCGVPNVSNASVTNTISSTTGYTSSSSTRTNCWIRLGLAG